MGETVSLFAGSEPIMQPNPYQSPNSPDSPSTPRLTVWQFLLVVLLCTLPFVGGLWGLVVGFMLWSQFCWTDERPIGFLSPTGVLLTLLTGLFFGTAATCYAVIRGRQLRKRL